jgi:hypothetical protein
MAGEFGIDRQSGIRRFFNTKDTKVKSKEGKNKKQKTWDKKTKNKKNQEQKTRNKNKKH